MSWVFQEDFLNPGGGEFYLYHIHVSFFMDTDDWLTPPGPSKTWRGYDAPPSLCFFVIALFIVYLYYSITQSYNHI